MTRKRVGGIRTPRAILPQQIWSQLERFSGSKGVSPTASALQYNYVKFASSFTRKMLCTCSCTMVCWTIRVTAQEPPAPTSHSEGSTGGLGAEVVRREDRQWQRGGNKPATVSFRGCPSAAVGHWTRKPPPTTAPTESGERVPKCEDF